MVGKRHNYVPFYIFITLLLMFLATLVATALHFAQTFSLDIKTSFEYMLQHRKWFYYSKYTLPSQLLSLILSLIIITFIANENRKYYLGREHGTAKWGNPTSVTKRLAKGGSDKLVSQHLRYSLNDQYTRLNANALIIGGPGSGKSRFFVSPNILSLTGSYVVTDPKGELLRKHGNYLRKHGYKIMVLNTKNLEQSDCYNPFVHLKSEEEIPRLIQNIFRATEEDGASKGDPFWERSEFILLDALMRYIYFEKEKEDQTLIELNELLYRASSVMPGKKISELEFLFQELEKTNPRHSAVRQWKKATAGAEDTIRSIVACAVSRIGVLENKAVQRVLQTNEIIFEEIGEGVGGDASKKVALFCVIPDADPSYNFIVSMLYAQLIQGLYDLADNVHEGRLPLHVSFYLDEFANIKLPPDFLNWISTARSRNISFNVIIQNLAQLKGLYPNDKWETIPGNCDMLLYLGGKEKSTHMYMSELLGGATIDTKKHGETMGKNGSASKNFDNQKRELLLPDEVRRINTKQCVIIIGAELPLIDEKIHIEKLPGFKEAESLGSYHHEKKEHTFVKPLTKRIAKKIFGNPLTEEEYFHIIQKMQHGLPVQLLSLSPERISSVERSKALLSFNRYTPPQQAIINEAIRRGIEPVLLNERMNPIMTVYEMNMIINELIRKEVS